eukprot:gnl/Carplike_NY0171/4773_a6502_328.p1 GENE.gnl/Carplike_NY0171/4773_a6502_328~~gnl/Carplike_NY0171/4773_a6502_328.p1  ORF type:complete len:441 (+),score=130.07 gnl/Carplike_NY0171/4773_a6502_328:19-1341(+)
MIEISTAIIAIVIPILIIVITSMILCRQRIGDAGERITSWVKKAGIIERTLATYWDLDMPVLVYQIFSSSSRYETVFKMLGDDKEELEKVLRKLKHMDSMGMPETQWESQYDDFTEPNLRACLVRIRQVMRLKRDARDLSSSEYNPEDPDHVWLMQEMERMYLPSTDDIEARVRSLQKLIKEREKELSDIEEKIPKEEDVDEETGKRIKILKKSIASLREAIEEEKASIPGGSEKVSAVETSKKVDSASGDDAEGKEEDKKVEDEEVEVLSEEEDEDAEKKVVLPPKPKFTRIGFQRDCAYTDFRALGMLVPAVMVGIMRVNPGTTRKIISKTGSGTEKELPFALTLIQVLSYINRLLRGGMLDIRLLSLDLQSDVPDDVVRYPIDLLSFSSLVIEAFSVLIEMWTKYPRRNVMDFPLVMEDFKFVYQKIIEKFNKNPIE